jgi:16S rRNA processing protein RimM
MNSSGWVAVGVVRGAFGVQGALKIEPYAAVESSVLNHVRRWRIERPQASGAASTGGVPPGPSARQAPFPLPAEVAVQSVKQHGGFVIVTITPPVTREQALALKGAEIQVDREDFPAPDPDEYYWADLIGCEVVDPTGKVLGTVVAIDDHGAQSVLRLDNQMLIPFVAACILEVATKQKQIVADWSADWV